MIAGVVNAHRTYGGMRGEGNGVSDMKEDYTAVIKQSGRWWIGWIEEVPGVNCQEATKEELLESLRVTLREALEFNRQEALEAAGDSFKEELITI
jgi:predicted RNase H-like HicB family nuclease